VLLSGVFEHRQHPRDEGELCQPYGGVPRGRVGLSFVCSTKS
jgi:hypothetical protein